MSLIEYLQRFIAPEIASLKTDVKGVKENNSRIMKEIKELYKKDRQIVQRVSKIEGRLDSLAEETWAKLENIYLKRQRGSATGKDAPLLGS
jgi:predicted nuclease with TOPRIM domain